MNGKNKKEMQETKEIALSDQQAIAVKRQNIVQRCSYINIDGDECSGEYCELSVYSKRPATHEQVVEECAPLLVLFPETTSSMFLLLHKYIEDAQMSVERLHEAVDWLITHHKYRTFSIADIVGYDKTITVARDIRTLKFVTKNKYLRYEDIVVIRGNLEGNECKMFGVKTEVEKSPYRSRVIGTWNSEINTWNILGQVKDMTIEQRKIDFKQSIIRYCNNSLQEGVKYDTDEIKRFYEYYSQVVGFGDMLLFEQFMSWNIDSALRIWCKKRNVSPQLEMSHIEKTIEQRLKEKEGKKLRNKLRIQVIQENAILYKEMSVEAANQKIQELIDRKMKEKGLSI